MKPKKHAIPPKGNQKFRATSRQTPLVKETGKIFRGPPLTKAQQIGEFVLKKIPTQIGLGFERKRIFRVSADSSLRNKRAIELMYCAERSNLAIALLNGAGIKSWLARGLIFEKNIAGEKWYFHDTVEFSIKGKIYSLDFLDDVNHTEYVTPKIRVGPVEDHPHRNDVVVFLRGADSKQLRVRNWTEYNNFSTRFLKNPFRELRNDLRRIDLLGNNGIIPKNTANALRERSKTNFDRVKKWVLKKGAKFKNSIK
jgi:hypothetical protein